MDFSSLPELIKGFFTGAKQDMKTIPHTAISAVLLWLTLWGAGVLGWIFVYPKIAIAAEAVPKVQQLDSTMQELKAQLVVDKMERKLKSMQDEIFTLQQEIKDHETKRRPIPTSTLVRLNTLSIEKVVLERRLDQFTSKNAELLEYDP